LEKSIEGVDVLADAAVVLLAPVALLVAVLLSTDWLPVPWFPAVVLDAPVLPCELLLREEDEP
jgi:hypothetical protein